MKRVFLGAVIFNRPILNRTCVRHDCGWQVGAKYSGRLSRHSEEVIGRAVLPELRRNKKALCRCRFHGGQIGKSAHCGGSLDGRQFAILGEQDDESRLT